MNRVIMSSAYSGARVLLTWGISAVQWPMVSMVPIANGAYSGQSTRGKTGARENRKPRHYTMNDASKTQDLPFAVAPDGAVHYGERFPAPGRKIKGTDPEEKDRLETVKKLLD
ncbi:MAG: hypothetical protein OXU71_11710, partial [Gammaproteobacteria bacterium]|nr:hypothetical protein [Gammaproteobacteria bacterium]